MHMIWKAHLAFKGGQLKDTQYPVSGQGPQNQPQVRLGEAKAVSGTVCDTVSLLISLGGWFQSPKINRIKRNYNLHPPSHSGDPPWWGRGMGGGPRMGPNTGSLAGILAPWLPGSLGF